MFSKPKQDAGNSGDRSNEPLDESTLDDFFAGYGTSPTKSTFNLVVDSQQLARNQRIAQRMATHNSELISKLGFPNASARGDIVHCDREGLILLSDLSIEGAVQYLNRVADGLAKARKDLFEEILPTLKLKEGISYFLLFQNAEDYRTFTERYATHFQLDLRGSTPAKNDGFSFEGIAQTTYNSNDPFRSVMVHEFTHAMSAAEAGIYKQGDWFQEGLAVFIQGLYHYEGQHFQELVAAKRNSGQFLPLEQLCSGNRIQTKDYLQAASVVLYLPEWGTKVGIDSRDLFNAFRACASTNLPALLGADRWQDFKQGWEEHMATEYL